MAESDPELVALATRVRELTVVAADENRDGRLFEPVVAAVAEVIPAARTLLVRAAPGAAADGRLAGTTTSFPSQTTVPGGAMLPLAAVTRVGVRADRTRRGLAAALMLWALRDVSPEREKVSTGQQKTLVQVGSKA